MAKQYLKEFQKLYLNVNRFTKKGSDNMLGELIVGAVISKLLEDL